MCVFVLIISNLAVTDLNTDSFQSFLTLVIVIGGQVICTQEIIQGKSLETALVFKKRRGLYNF